MATTRGPLMPVDILGSAYKLQPDGAETVLPVCKVAVGPMTERTALALRRFGDLARVEEALRKVIEA